MIGRSRISGWVLTALLAMLASCATEPYYEAAPTMPVNASPGEDVSIIVNAQTTFVWQPTDNTQFYQFHIYNQTNKDTTQYSRDKLLQDKVCTDGLCRLTLNVNLPLAKSHAWRVRSANNAGFSEWNRTRFSMVDASSEAASSANTGVEAGVSVELSSQSLGMADQTTSAVDSDASIGSNTTVAKTVTNANEPANPNAAYIPGSDGPLPSVELISDDEPNASVRTNSKTKPKVAQSSLPTPSIPDLIQPIEGVKVEAGSLVDFKWRSLVNAVSYDFFIYDSISKEMVESLTGIAATTLCRSGNVCRLTRAVSLPVASHAWRVRANYKNGQSPFASSRFAVVR